MFKNKQPYRLLKKTNQELSTEFCASYFLRFKKMPHIGKMSICRLVVTILFVVIFLIFKNQNIIPTGWYSFNMTWDDNKNTFISRNDILDAPSGKHGFVTSKNGHLYFEDGTRIRFWGANLGFAANFPDHDSAEKISKRLAKLGFNIVRMHHMDSGVGENTIFDTSNNTTQILSETQMDNLDYFIYCLKNQGIYVDMNLLVSRKFLKNDGVVDYNKLPTGSKIVTIFDRKLIDLQKKYASQLFSHYNPYTKKSYSQDPTIALVEISNENSIFDGWVYKENFIFGEGDIKPNAGLTDYYVKELDIQWNNWLKEKYGSSDKLKNEWTSNNGNYEIEMVKNGDFENGITNWTNEIHDSVNSINVELTKNTIDSKYIQATAVNKPLQPYMIQAKQYGIKIEVGKSYVVKFRAKANSDKTIGVVMGKNVDPYTNYGLWKEFNITSNWKDYQCIFKANETANVSNQLTFILGYDEGTVMLDNVSMKLYSEDGLINGEWLENGTVKRMRWAEKQNYSQKRVMDNIEFYNNVEEKYYKEMQDYLKNTLKVRVPISTTNTYYGLQNTKTRALGDYMDMHNYWDHPMFKNEIFDKDVFVINNKSLIKDSISGFNKNIANSSYLGTIATSRVAGKPFILSEWSIGCFPNEYEYEAALYIMSYALLQDWDGVFVYSYSQESVELMKNTSYVNNWFDVYASSGKLAQMISCATSFIRGDILPASKKINLNYAANDVQQNLIKKSMNNELGLNTTLPNGLLYKYAFGIQSFEATETSKVEDLLVQDDLNSFKTTKTITSDTGEIVLNGDISGSEYLLINAPKMQAVSGFIANKKHILKNAMFMVNKNATVSLLSNDNKPIGSSNELLLSVVAKQQNTDQIWSLTRTTIFEWGHSPVLLEKVTGDISIKFDKPPKDVAIYSLNTEGNRNKGLIRASLKDNSANFSLSTLIDSPWYEIAVVYK